MNLRIKKKIFSLLSLNILLWSLPITAWASQVQAEAPPGMAKMAPPRPPQANPHPPQSPAEQHRVDFAMAEARKFYGASLVEMKHAHVIPWSWNRFQPQTTTAAPTDDPNVIVEAQASGKQPPLAKVLPSTPQLGSDEYMVHAYVLFAGDNRWHHLDIILSEDSAGQVALRGFYAIPMPYVDGHLPPGVVC